MAEALWIFIISFIAAFITSMYCTCKRTYKEDKKQKVCRKSVDRKCVESVEYEKDRN